MFKIANNLVGRVGKTTKKQYSVTNEEYIEFVFFTKNKNEIIPVWKKWIKSYIAFAPFCHKGLMKLIFKPLWIYWRIKPEIRKTGDIYQYYARLLITTLTPKFII